MKKIILKTKIFLTVVMCFMLATSFVACAPDKDNMDLKTAQSLYMFSEKDNQITIDRYIGSDTEVIIPDKIDGKKVVAIGGAAFNYISTKITSVVISDNVEIIKDFAFDGCSDLMIYCKAESQPSGWSMFWNHSFCPVFWYSESQPAEEGYFWHYVDGVVTQW